MLHLFVVIIVVTVKKMGKLDEGTLSEQGRTTPPKQTQPTYLASSLR